MRWERHLRLSFRDVRSASSLRSRTRLLGRAPVCAIFLCQAIVHAQNPHTCKGPVALERELRTHPSAATSEALGVYFGQHKQSSCAVAAFRKAVQLDPRYEQAYVDMALVLKSQGRLDEAESEVRIALGISPDDTKALTAHGVILARMKGRAEEAISELRRVVVLAPDSGDAHLNLGIALADEFDLQGAVAEFSEAVRLAPERAAPHYNLGRALSDLGRGEEAKPELEAAIKLDPSIGDAFYLLAKIETQTGDADAAESHFRRAVALMPRNDTALYMLGQSLQRRGDLAGAVKCWRQAIAINPEYLDAYYNLSRATAQSNPAESKKFLARFQELQVDLRQRDRAQTLGNFALAAADAKDWPRAFDQLKEAIEICASCSALPRLHKNLGLIYCRSLLSIKAVS